jgi:hypothetical protein
MGERYLISGVQLGSLFALDKRESRQKLIDEIIEKQFIATSGQPIEADVHNIIKLLR